MKSINILTLFPEFFDSPFSSGLVGKFFQKGIVDIHIHDIRAYSTDTFHRCDDYPYGGGSGMVMKIEPLERALQAVKDPGVVILTSPSGRRLDQPFVKHAVSTYQSMTIVCGHYEGVDQRFIDGYVDMELSIGDYVLSGGEFAALVFVDAVIRYIPGFMSNPGSLSEESFEDGLLEYPHYTRPEVYKEMRVPSVLLSGNHAEIAKWRYQKRVEKTAAVRPDLPGGKRSDTE